MHYDPSGAGVRRSNLGVIDVPTRKSREFLRVTSHLPPRTPEQDVQSATRDGRTTQSSLLVIVPIKPSSSLEELQKLLGAIANPPGGKDLEVNPVIPFRRLGTVHFARIFIHAASPSAEAPIPTW